MNTPDLEHNQYQVQICDKNPISLCLSFAALSKVLVAFVILSTSGTGRPCEVSVTEYNGLHCKVKCISQFQYLSVAALSYPRSISGQVNTSLMYLSAHPIPKYRSGHPSSIVPTFKHSTCMLYVLLSASVCKSFRTIWESKLLQTILYQVHWPGLSISPSHNLWKEVLEKTYTFSGKENVLCSSGKFHSLWWYISWLK